MRSRDDGGPPRAIYYLWQLFPSPSSPFQRTIRIFELSIYFHHFNLQSVIKMDALLAEISAKRKALEVPEGDAGAKKYMRRADIERMREEEERRKKEEERKEKEAKKAQEAKEKTVKVSTVNHSVSDV